MGGRRGSNRRRRGWHRRWCCRWWLEGGCLRENRSGFNGFCCDFGGCEHGFSFDSLFNYIFIGIILYFRDFLSLSLLWFSSCGFSSCGLCHHMLQWWQRVDSRNLPVWVVLPFVFYDDGNLFCFRLALQSKIEIAFYFHDVPKSPNGTDIGSMNVHRWSLLVLSHAHSAH